jgi:hypothetical protein
MTRRAQAIEPPPVDLLDQLPLRHPPDPDQQLGDGPLGVALQVLRGEDRRTGVADGPDLDQVTCVAPALERDSTT